MADVLEIKNLAVSFDAQEGTVSAVRGVSLSVKEGEVVAIVGESGCGKSALAQAVLRLHPEPPAHIEADVLRLGGYDVLDADKRELKEIRGAAAGMVFQDPMSCMNPTMRVGRQITEALSMRKKMSAAECKREAIRLLELVHIPNAALCARQYPHELSGGMRQRALIAMALACSPRLLIADEPTTALDVTIQLEILKLLAQLQREMGMAVLLISHDLGVVANLADRVMVMYAGNIIEQGPVRDVLEHPGHPYTQGLLDSLPASYARKGIRVIPGAPPSLTQPMVGCPFAPRCRFAMQICLREKPCAHVLGEGHDASCWLLHPQAKEAFS